ncbi:MAG: PKD domain-containing protein [Acidobacteria bacterium]|nr:PKD domain-containing protein [Acidobacteriota bacterium]
MTRRINVVALIAGVALAGSLGCKAKTQDAPPLAGPSELATAITIYASPDTITQDGASQSQITIQARDARSQPIANLPIRLETRVNGVVADFGQLSSKQLVTGGDGRATASYTAPDAPQSAADVLSSVTILATPVGADAAGATARSVTIRLTSPGIVIPPSNAPKAVMAFTPNNPLAGTDVVFDGGLSTVTGARIVTYAWDFGDGSTGSGSPVTHRFVEGGTFTVRLTVADDRGLTGTTTGDVTVRDTSSPTASFVFSPTNPVVNQRIFFNGTGSTAAAGRTVVSYAWDFGNDQTATGANVSTSYPAVQEYVVSLTVTDDLGKKNTATKTVGIGAGGSVAHFSFSPTAPTTGQVVSFNASGSSSQFPITGYTWDFGDSSTGTGVNPTHTYASAATYVVRLIVTDSNGSTASTTNNVTVTASGATPPTATFTFSPSSPGVNESVFFNGSTSTPGAGHTIVSYAWSFGNVAGFTGTGVTTFTSYTTAGTYSVQLKVTDEVGQSVTSAVQTVTVGNPPAPTANFTSSPTGPVVSDNVVFDASSSTTAQGQTITNLAWNFGDGTPIVTCPGDSTCVGTRIISHSYTQAGTYVVNLVVTDSAGRTGAKSATVTVGTGNPEPVVTFSPTTGAHPITIGFSSVGSRLYSGATIRTWAWDFGDAASGVNNTASNDNPSHQYVSGGTYTVRLTITDSRDRVGTTTVTVIIQ